MRRAIAAEYPGDVVPPVAVAVVGEFASICHLSSGKRDLVAIINAELREVGLELRPTRRH